MEHLLTWYFLLVAIVAIVWSVPVPIHKDIPRDSIAVTTLMPLTNYKRGISIPLLTVDGYHLVKKEEHPGSEVLIDLDKLFYVSEIQRITSKQDLMEFIHKWITWNQ